MPHQQRQLAFIAKYTADLCHVAGMDNVVADAHSRPPEALSALKSTTVAGVKVPYGLLAASEDSDGTAGAFPQLPPSPWAPGSFGHCCAPSGAR